ncbi:uncharacterized protein [Engystomops pustulosus]|uniref:uncharacterized protein n=1 Tax=Engystomops pustulosus TaxID=76066 RepID=UPI003AFA67D4
MCFVVPLEDILVLSPDLETHQFHVQQVLGRLQANRLYAKLEKCQFHLQHLPFLDYIISDKDLQMDPAKLSAVLQWPHPEGLQAIQRFLGFVNYYWQFIPHYSTLVSPVALTKKGANPRLWALAAEEAFPKLKSAFASAPVLTRPDAEKPFLLEVDASSREITLFGIENF